GVDLQVGDADHSLAHAVAAADEGAQAGQELGELEGLDQVVVGAGVEAAHPVRQPIARGEDQHRGRILLFPQGPQHGQAVQLGQHDVEDDRVIRVGLRVPEALLAVGGAIHRIAGLAQSLGHRASQRFVIFDEEHAHRRRSASMAWNLGPVYAAVGPYNERTMNIRDYAVAMAAYNKWLNEKVYRIAAGISDHERKRNLGAFFKSIHGTLNHILLGDQSWMQRFGGHAVTMTGPDQELFADFGELSAARRKMDDTIAAWAAELDEAFSVAPLRFYSVTYKKEHVIPGWA